MASDQNDTVFPEVELDDDDESQEDEEDDDDDDVLPEPDDVDVDASSALPSSTVTVAVPFSAVSNGAPTPLSVSATTIVLPDPSAADPKRAAADEKKPLDDSRRLFQRLWTDEDEMELLQGFLDYTAQRGSSHHNDTALFYDQIKSKLQLDFNKNQLVEKLRRLKKKYRNVLNKISAGKELSFKSPHDQATFEISRKIWSNLGSPGIAAEDNALDDDEISPNPNPNPNFILSLPKNEVILGISAERRTPPSRKRSRSRSGVRIDERRDLNDGLAPNKDNYNYCIGNSNANANANANANTSSNNNNHSNSHTSVPGLIEETVRSCLSPLLKEIMSSATNMGVGGPFGARGLGGLPLSAMPLSFGGPSMMNYGIGETVDEKWRKQQILELEVYSKRLELVQEQIKAALEDLRSAGR